MKDSIDEHGFRANVGIVLVRADQQVFLGGRMGGQVWQFPQGGILCGETPEQALYRELKEEIGLEAGAVKILATTKGWLRYRLPKQYQRHDPKQFCIGQKQRWFMLQFVGDELQFNLNTTTHPEFDCWRWADYWTPVREVIFFKKAVYARALEELAVTAFAQHAPPLPQWWQEERSLRNLVARRNTKTSALTGI